MGVVTEIKVDGVLYVECVNVTKYVNFEEKQIEFDSVMKLFYCSENKTLVPLE